MDTQSSTNFSTKPSRVHQFPYIADVKAVSVHQIHGIHSKRARATQSSISRKSTLQNSLILSETNNTFNGFNVRKRSFNKPKRTLTQRQICLIVIVAAIVAAILAAITAIVLALTLPSKTTMTSTTTTSSKFIFQMHFANCNDQFDLQPLQPAQLVQVRQQHQQQVSAHVYLEEILLKASNDLLATVCSNAGRGNVGLLTGYASPGWTQYSATFTAVQSKYALVFGFQADVNRSWILDDISLVKNSAPAIEILLNPSFGNSSVSIINWVLWCSSYCQFGTSGKLLTGADCYLGTGNCFTSACLGPGVEFLGQYFSASVGSTYTITFELSLTGISSVSSTMFYVDILP
ncbi:unnamed protein product [Rotaria magnacalcarata]|uniref:Uncharacterized protein n=1 Tax=Rotaria magnacalcarata TaxID=392030 RepID=A0A816SIJ6_9BILA|nr:unnamed protein product [Rotaria magnacalcarata]